MDVIFLIARCELVFFRLSTFGQIAITTVLVLPILLILSVERGVISDLRSYLEADPESLRLRLNFSQSLDSDWFEAISNDPRVGFIAPHPYENATHIDVISNTGRRDTAAMLASGENDPFLPPGVAPPGDSEVLLTEIMALNFDAEIGDEIVFEVDCFSLTEPVDYQVVVTGILDRSAWSTKGALVSQNFLTEFYLCKNHASPLFGNPGPTAPQNVIYPQFRLFANSLEDVHALTDALLDSGVQVHGNFASADLADSVERTAETVIATMIIALGVGAALALSSAIHADVRRLRPDLATLRMDGLTSLEAVSVVALKSLIIAASGSVLSIGAFFGLITLLNTWIAKHPLPFETHARLDMFTGAAVILVVVSISLLAGIRAANRIFTSSPLEDQNAA